MVPALEQYTYVLTPADFAAFAFSTQRSWSMAHWAATEPALAKVVPTALKMTEGVGVSVAIRGPHFVVSASMIDWSFGFWIGGARRETVVRDVQVEAGRSVVRI